ncbi:hypothetical protein [Streptomyces sp. NBC_01285]|uniref:hypothetical protein n=1 Tax=Streptomyces sp. NBC_01285 TaxID=2903813 RepID=UPI002259E864|nr:hypothetical protein [Streptomyces sp. NBC_01285]MCX4771862.1 hypothetical protein [Streptomyces sp. NBC_01285]
MATTRPHEPALLDPKGPVITVIACTVGAILMLGAGGACVFCVVLATTGIGGTHGGWTWGAAGLALVAAFIAWVGYCTILNARVERQATLQLAAVGVDSTALVLTVASAPSSNEDHPQIRLLMRISGPGFETFESTSDVPAYHFGRATQGTVLPARVNPASRVFTLE